MTKNEYDKMRGVEDPRTSSSDEKPMSSKGDVRAETGSKSKSSRST